MPPPPSLVAVVNVGRSVHLRRFSVVFFFSFFRDVVYCGSDGVGRRA